MDFPIDRRLLLSLNNVKSSIDYKGKDFDADRAAQNAALRTEMVKKFDWEYFGPETTKNIAMDDGLTTEERQENKKEAKEMNARVKMGYNRV